MGAPDTQDLTNPIADTAPVMLAGWVLDGATGSRKLAPLKMELVGGEWVLTTTATLSVSAVGVDSICVTDPNLGVGRVSATANVAGAPGVIYKITSAVCSCSDQDYKVEIKINNVVVWSVTASAGTACGINFGTSGPCGAAGQAVSVVCTPIANGLVSANLTYYQK